MLNYTFLNSFAIYYSALFSVMPMFLAETTVGQGLKFLGAGVAIAGAFGAGIGQGHVGQGACMAIGRNPEMSSKITTTMIIAAGIAESGAIYCFIVAILLIFVV